MRRAITLIEVVVGIGMLAALLTAMLVAAEKLSRQFRTAEDKLAAVGMLDELMSRFVTSEYPQSGEEGPVAGKADWYWRFESSPAAFGPELVSKSRLRIVDRRRDDFPLASLEIVHLKGVSSQGVLPFGKSP